MPVLGKLAVSDIQEGTVRRWRKSLLDSGVGPVTVAKAYRLLKAIMNTAVDDGLRKRNPCRIDGAGQEHSPERPVLTVAQIFALADAFTERRYRLLILLAVFCSLCWGERAALARYCVDTNAGIISVRASVVELARGPLVTGPPKSAAGRRDVVVPAFLLPDVIAHLEAFTAGDPRALVFTGPKGAQLRRSNFSGPWSKATAVAGLEGFHFHDLRHTGNVLAGEAGVTLRELMDLMGHASTRAALIYQYRTTQRDKIIADEISRRAKAELKRSGAQRARGKKKHS